MTLTEILNGQLTPEEMEQFKPLLANTKFSGAIESKLSNFEQAASTAQAKADETMKWYNEKALPTLDAEMKARQEAEAKAAGFEAKIRTMAAQGLTTFEEPPVTPPTPVTPPNADYLSRKDFDSERLKFADMQGRAMAQFSSISNQHLSLFGKPLTNFEELYDKARVQGKSLKDIWQADYKVEAKQQEIADKQKADYEAQIRADERTKILSAQGNPATRDAWPSQNSFIPKPSNGETAMPWSKPDGGREARLKAAFTAQAQRGVQ